MNKKIEKAVLASLRQAVAIQEGTARPATPRERRKYEKDFR